tara:strand:- start:4620 stop:4862 length:243 start_codon:yes stop_codon:yes gene_type:complete
MAISMSHFNTSAAGLPTWKKYICMSQYVENLRVKEKRRIFQLMRLEGMHEDVFMPHLGLTIAEFSCFQVLADSQKRSTCR